MSRAIINPKIEMALELAKKQSVPDELPAWDRNSEWAFRRGYLQACKDAGKEVALYLTIDDVFKGAN